VARRWSDETRAEYTTAMGSELAAVYVPLGEALTELHHRWTLFAELYGDLGAVDVLNRAAPVLFATFRRVIADDMMLQLSKLTDRTEIGRFHNLTIQRLPELVVDTDLRAEVETLVATAVEATANARQHRQKTIAHFDLEVALGNAVEPLPAITRNDLENALHAVTHVLQHLEQHYRESDVDFNPVTLPKASAALLNCLDMGLRTADARLARLRERKPTPEDLTRPRW